MFPRGHIYADYQLLSDAFPGGQGEVYKALHIPTSKEVALKFTKTPHDKVQYKRFKNENKFLHVLSPHQHIVKARSNVTHDKLNAYYSMEYIEQGLEGYLGTISSTDTDRKLELYVQICKGLKHAHSKNIYHRDLHPANIRIDIDQAKLVDFGLGKDGLGSPSSRIGIWFGGAVTTPETTFCVSDNPTHDEDVRRDTYALGIILFNIFSSSNVPYTLGILGSIQTYFMNLGMSNGAYLKLSESERLNHYKNWLQSLPSTLRDTLNISLADIDLSNKISTIIKKACHSDYTQRYGSVQDIIIDIEGL